MMASKYAVNEELSLVKKHEYKKYKIYMHYDTETGKVYIGKTSQKPEARFSTGASKGNPYGYWGRFKEYLQDHSLEDMEHVILATTDDKEEAKRLEEEYIELYQSTDPRYGFNSFVGDVPNEKYHEAVVEASCIYQYTILHPNGEETVTDNLNAFCKENNINRSAMVQQGHTKGYKLTSKTLKSNL